MEKITITEALQEIKTIGKRIAKKRESIMSYIARDSRLKDPLERDGGTHQYIASERQSIRDLNIRLVAIRTAIQRVNLATPLSLHGETRTIAEWLTWRREVSVGVTTFYTQMRNVINNLRTQLSKEGRKLVEADNAPTDVIVYINEREMLQESERHEQLLGDLDGKLSLLNATTTIEI